MNNLVKKITCLFLFVFMPMTINAARLDISRIKREDEFSVTFGAYYRTGLNAAQTHQTDWDSGRVNESSINIAYTPTENLTLVFSTGNDYSDSEVGIQYKLITYHAVKLVALADYGIAWTHDAATDARHGNNNVLAGLRVDGVIDAFQWAVSVRPQYVWAYPDDFWNIKLAVQMMYYFLPDLATKVEFDLDFMQINLAKTMYNKALTAGLVYNFTNKVAVNPYFKYHFHTVDYRTSYINYYDYFQVGLLLSVQF